MRAREGGSGTMRERKVPRLDSPTAALVRVAAAVATGKVPELDARLAAAREARVPGLWIEELLLQSMLVVGYPLALVAFGAWRRVGGPAPVEGDGAEDLAHADWQSWATRGAAVCREVYGRAYHKLLVNLRALHPALEDLVLVDAYGKVIGRPGRRRYRQSAPSCWYRSGSKLPLCLPSQVTKGVCCENGDSRGGGR